MKLRLLPLLLCVPVLVQSCASTSSASVNEESIPNLEPYDGPRATIALREFDWKVPKGAAYYGYNNSATVVGGLEDMLTNALVQSDRYWVMERMQFDNIKDEVGLKEDGWIQEGTGPERGTQEGAELAIYASVTEWNPDAGGKSIAGNAGGWLAGKVGLGGASLGKKKGVCTITIRIFDMATSRTLASSEVSGVAESYNFGAKGYGWMNGVGLGGGLSQYEDTPMGAAIRKAIAEAVVQVVEDTPQEFYRHP